MTTIASLFNRARRHNETIASLFGLAALGLARTRDAR